MNSQLDVVEYEKFVHGVFQDPYPSEERLEVLKTGLQSTDYIIQVWSLQALLELMSFAILGKPNYLFFTFDALLHKIVDMIYQNLPKFDPRIAEIFYLHYRLNFPLLKVDKKNKVDYYQLLVYYWSTYYDYLPEAKFHLPITETTEKTLPSLAKGGDRIESLWMRNTEISLIPDYIRHFPNLVELDLAFNRIWTISSHLSVLTKLEKLDLKNNELVQFPSVILNLTNLQELDLSENRIREIPIEIFKLKNLKKLNLSFNQIKTLPPEISRLEQLEQINLSFNKLTELAINFKRMRNLVNLRANDNAITNVSKSIKYSSLKKIDLYNNKLTYLPRSFFQIVNLETLIIHSNNIENIHYRKVNSSLIKIDLSNNKLKKFPLVFVKLDKIREVSLAGNRISRIPVDLLKMRSIRRLELQENQIRYFDYLTRRWRRYIKKMDQAYRRLTIHQNEFVKNPKGLAKYISETIAQVDESINILPKKRQETHITTFHYLRYIDLSNNRLVVLPEYLDKFILLKEIHLQGNQIVDILDLVKKLPSLTDFVDLSKNKLLPIDSQLIPKLNEGPTIRVQGNEEFTTKIHAYQRLTNDNIGNLQY